MIDANQVIHAIATGLAATTPLEAVSVILGLAYSLLAVKRSRLCWVAGGVGAAILIYLSLRAHLPMQAALQVYYVVMSVYGYWHWSRSQAQDPLAVTTWPLRHHLAACIAIVLVSAMSAHWLAARTQAAWPFLDSLTTWGSLFATWLVARVKLENWLYWIAIDSVLAYLFAVQGLYFVALLSAVYLGICVVGFTKWLKTCRAPVPAS